MAQRQKPKRSLFDHFINAIAVVILIFFVSNEFSHLYRVPETVAKAPELYERHYSLSWTFPFIGSYFLMVPEGYDPKYRYPLVIALHGVSKRIYAAEELGKADFRKRYPVFVMVPVAPGRAFWATPKNKAYRMKRNIPYPDHLPQVISGMTDIKNTYKIDNAREYIVGHSMGGSGVIGALERYPGLFTAGIASSGAWAPEETEHLNDPLLMIHGMQDRFVPFDQAQALANSLKKRGLPVIFQALKRQGHAIGPTVYSREQVWNWLFVQTKAPS